MKRLLTAIVVILFLCSTTNITAYASTTLISTSFRTNLVKGEYVEAEAVSEEPDESVDDELIGAAEEIITDVAEIAEPQDFDEHTDVSTPTDIEPIVDDGELEEPEQSQLDVPDNAGDSTVPEVETLIVCEDSEENEEENETEVQSTQ